MVLDAHIVFDGASWENQPMQMLLFNMRNSGWLQSIWIVMEFYISLHSFTNFLSTRQRCIDNNWTSITTIFVIFGWYENYIHLSIFVTECFHWWIYSYMYVEECCMVWAHSNIYVEHSDDIIMVCYVGNGFDQPVTICWLLRNCKDVTFPFLLIPFPYHYCGLKWVE